MAESYLNLEKTLLEKEKLLVMNNFSFSHSAFKRLVSQGRQKVSLCWNELKDKIICFSAFSGLVLIVSKKSSSSRSLTLH